MPCADNGASDFYAEQDRLRKKHGSETAQVACTVIKWMEEYGLGLPDQCVREWWEEHKVEDKKKEEWEARNLPEANVDKLTCPECNTVLSRGAGSSRWRCQC